MKKNVLIVFTGNGKGKTTAAAGQALRYLKAGKKILIVQFFKPGTSGEIIMLKKLGARVLADPESKLPVDLSNETIISRQLKILRQAESAASKYNAFILDEFNYLASSPLINRQHLKNSLFLFLNYGDTIATGRNAPLWLVRMADTVSRIVEVKHHFKAGIDATEGREY